MRATSSSSTAFAKGVHRPKRFRLPAAAMRIQSRTVCSVNSCGNWKERTMPRSAIARGESSVTSLPSKKTRPACGLIKPVHILMNVVLPAPFCPITAKRSPSVSEKSIWSATTTAPKASCRFFVCNSGVLIHPPAST